MSLRGGLSSHAWLRAVLVGALGWTLLLVVLSFVLPAVTESSGSTGWQPRVSLVHHDGLLGALPAVGLLVAVGGAEPAAVDDLVPPLRRPWRGPAVSR